MVRALSVGGGGLELPVRPEQVAALLEIGAPAPYGHDTDTVLDTAVRKATEVDAALVAAAPVCEQLVRGVTTGAVAALGLAGAQLGVEARLYKVCG